MVGDDKKNLTPKYQIWWNFNTKFGVMVRNTLKQRQGKTLNTVPAVRVPLATWTRVKSQKYVECRGPRGNSRLTTVARNPRLPKKKKKTKTGCKSRRLSV